MLEFFNRFDAITLLKEDHDKVKSLFARFEDSDSRREKSKIARQAILELKLHAAIEEEIFYPAVRNFVGHDLMNEADEEHHVAKLLIAELDMMDISDEYFDAKFKVLAENVRHHIREEEYDMFYQARKMDMDFEALAEEMLDYREDMLRRGTPLTPEEDMISNYRGFDDSPAQTAQKKKPAPKAETTPKLKPTPKADDAPKRRPGRPAKTATPKASNSNKPAANTNKPEPNHVLQHPS